MRAIAGFVRFFACLFLLSAISCSHSGNNGNSFDDKFMMSSLVRDTNPAATDAELAAAAAGNTDFALKALPLVPSDPDTNTVFSPYSITLALALTAAGAAGTTLSEIETAMSFSLPQDRLNPALNKLDLVLASRTTGTVYENGARSPQLNIVNAVWGQDGFPLLQSYLDKIAENYGAGLHLVDYINATEDARLTINSWVEKQTNSRIRDLMQPGVITAYTRLVLTNAIWFKGNWASKFPVNNTKNQTFFNHDNTEPSVSFMSNTLSAGYAKSNGWQAVDIPYVDGNLSMLVIMPVADTFDGFLATLTPASLSDIVAQLTGTQVALSMPKFTFNTALDMKFVLTALGMTAAFDPGIADFSGIDGGFDLFIQAVVHQAFINVDENGTEAAAATAVIIGPTSAPPPLIIVNVDHPFIFMIRDRQTGLILFLGKVVTL